MKKTLPTSLLILKLLALIIISSLSINNTWAFNIDNNDHFFTEMYNQNTDYQRDLTKIILKTSWEYLKRNMWKDCWNNKDEYCWDWNNLTYEELEQVKAWNINPVLNHLKYFKYISSDDYIKIFDYLYDYLNKLNTDTYELIGFLEDLEGIDIYNNNSLEDSEYDLALDLYNVWNFVIYNEPVYKWTIGLAIDDFEELLNWWKPDLRVVDVTTWKYIEWTWDVTDSDNDWLPDNIDPDDNNPDIDWDWILDGEDDDIDWDWNPDDLVIENWIILDSVICEPWKINLNIKWTSLLNELENIVNPDTNIKEVSNTNYVSNTSLNNIDAELQELLILVLWYALSNNQESLNIEIKEILNNKIEEIILNNIKDINLKNEDWWDTELNYLIQIIQDSLIKILNDILNWKEISLDELVINIENFIKDIINNLLYNLEEAIDEILNWNLDLIKDILGKEWNIITGYDKYKIITKYPWTFWVWNNTINHGEPIKSVLTWWTQIWYPWYNYFIPESTCKLWEILCTEVTYENYLKTYIDKYKEKKTTDINNKVVKITNIEETLSYNYELIYKFKYASLNAAKFTRNFMQSIFFAPDLQKMAHVWVHVSTLPSPHNLWYARFSPSKTNTENLTYNNQNIFRNKFAESWVMYNHRNSLSSLNNNTNWSLRANTVYLNTDQYASKMFDNAQDNLSNFNNQDNLWSIYTKNRMTEKYMDSLLIDSEEILSLTSWFTERIDEIISLIYKLNEKPRITYWSR